MRLLRTLTAAATALTVLSLTPPVFANTGAERTAVDEAEASTERQARGEIESLIGRLCPGRCELVELQVTADEPSTIGDIRPGFESAAGPSQYDVEIRRIEATVMMDSTLPENFQANLPRMAQFRLQQLAQTVEIRPELLEFPDPQLPPMPEGLQQPPEPPAEPPPALPEPTDEDAAPTDDAPEDAAAPEEERTEATPPLWQQFLPWIALLLTLLILGGLIILILRRLEAMSTADDSRIADAAVDTGAGDPQPDVDTDALRQKISGSRPALNRMLRRWIQDDPREVAQLVRLIGPDILSDVRRDPQFRPALETVSDHVAELDEGIDASTARALAQKARSRYEAQLVVEDSDTDAEWAFLEGLTLGQISKLLETTSRRETGFVLTRLPPALRSRYLENLQARDRRELMLEASSSETLSRTQSRQLAARLRRVAEEFPDQVRETDGRAQMLMEMLEAMGTDERCDVLADMLEDRPDVARAVLSKTCLEPALLEIPDEAIADAVHRMPVDILTTFLQGTDGAVAERILDVAPGSKRQAVSTELSLEIPVTRADFLEARQTFSTAVVTSLRNNGFDVARYNSAVLQSDTRQSSTTEVAQ